MICRKLSTMTVIGLTALGAAAAHADDRLPTIPPAQYSVEQKQAAVEFEAARKTAVFGPFEPMMHSPQLMSDARAMGDYLRFKSSIGNTLSELVILMTAREWTQNFEWSYHYPVAIKAGLRQELLDAIAVDKRPTGMTPDEEIVYNFTHELLKKKQVSDATFERAKARFGTKGVVDMAGISGYYTFLAMQLNMANYQTVVKDGKPLPPLNAQ
jgi:4-carboxymuconolactone decarboxylase